ncbi:MAG: hypothetical protein WEC39_01630 [Patescibacteria group bacterium]
MFEKQQEKFMEELMKDPKKLQAEFADVVVEARERGVKVVKRGEEIESVEVDGVEREDIKRALNKADKEFKKQVNKKLRRLLLSSLKVPGFK